MATNQSILSAIDLIYGAATDETLSPQVLRQLIATTDSQAACFYTLRDGEPPQLTTKAS